MKITRTKFTVNALCQEWQIGSLVRNDEYQRGEKWSSGQKQALVDSVLRGYLVPPLCIREVERVSQLTGESSKKYEIIDGQQRILALNGFVRDEFQLLASDNPKLRLPMSLRSAPAPWSGLTFSKLDAGIREVLLNSTIDAYVINSVENPDMVRDQFIRLQSGTALNRQEVRDAWPGTVGPYVVSLAGKLSIAPKAAVFGLIDGRGVRREEDERDPYVGHRQACAQLLLAFVARERDPNDFPPLGFAAIDTLYHQQTEFDPKGPIAEAFEDCLAQAERIVRQALVVRSQRGISKRLKIAKLTFFSLIFFLQDLRVSRSKTLERSAEALLAQRLTMVDGRLVQGKGTAGRTLESHYVKWRALVNADGLISGELADRVN